MAYFLVISMSTYMRCFNPRLEVYSPQAGKALQAKRKATSVGPLMLQVLHIDKHAYCHN